MDNKWEFRTNLIKTALIVTIIVSVLSMAVMVTYAESKVVVVVDDEGTEEAVAADTRPVSAEWVIDTKADDSLTDSDIIIPIPKDLDTGLINVSERYDTRTLTVTFECDDSDFFLRNESYGSFEHVTSGRGEYGEDYVELSYQLTEMCDVETSYNNGEVKLKLTKYDADSKPVVVIDAAHGGSQTGIRAGECQEKDITLSIALKVKELAADKNYKVVLTRGCDELLSTEERVNITELVGADYYIGIQLSSDIEDTKNYGMYAYYNSVYYMRGLENVVFADAVLKNAVTLAKDRALGLKEAGEDEVILKVFDFPATVLYAGYMTNSDELMLLQSEDYIESIARGILNALDETVGK